MTVTGMARNYRIAALDLGQVGAGPNCLSIRHPLAATLSGPCTGPVRMRRSRRREEGRSMTDPSGGRMNDDAKGQLLLQAMQEARNGVKLLANVVEASSSVSCHSPSLEEVAQAMQELAFQTWLLAVEARAQAGRLARLSGHEAHAPNLGDAS
jgi:hypothetical protein